MIMKRKKAENGHGFPTSYTFNANTSSPSESWGMPAAFASIYPFASVPAFCIGLSCGIGARLLHRGMEGGIIQKATEGH